MSEVGCRPNVEPSVKEINMLSMSMILFFMKCHLTLFVLIISDMNDVDYYYYLFNYCIPTIHTLHVFINYSYLLSTIFIYWKKYVKYEWNR